METHNTPAAMRKTGLVSLKHYLKLGFAALLYIIIVSRYIWVKERFSRWEWEDLLRYDGEMLKFYLLSGISISLILYLLFGSKFGVYRMAIAKNIYIYASIFCFFYLATLIGFEFDYHLIDRPEQIALAIILGIFVILAALPTFFEKNKKVSDFSGKVLPVFLIIAVFTVQVWHKDNHLGHIFWMLVCPFLFFFVRPTKSY